MPSLSHTPVKTCFLLFCTSGSFQQTMSLDPHPVILVLSHLQWCSHTQGLNYTQWNSCWEWPKYMEKEKEQAAPYSSLFFLHYIHSLKICVVRLLHTDRQVENFQTCKSAFAWSHQLVHRSDTHCLGHIPDKCMCFVYFTVQKCMEDNSAVFLFQTYAVWMEA